MPPVVASQAASVRNARKRRKDAEKESSRNQERIKYERQGFKDSFTINGVPIKSSESDSIETIQLQSDNKYDHNNSQPPLEKQGTDFMQQDYDSLDGFGKFSHSCQRLVEHPTFNFVIILFIILAGILVGVQTYSGMDSIFFVKVIENTILFVFIVEIFVKVLAQNRKPWRYFVGSDALWNTFDFVIVFMTLPIWEFGSSTALLRLLRLLRVVKIVKKIPQLFLIVSGLIGGLKSIGYILLLMFLIFYLYSIIGWYLFTPNDEFHFGNLFRGLLSLWRISTFEDWTNIFYINYYGCRSELYLDGLYKQDAAAAQNPAEAESFSLILCPEEKNNAAPLSSVLYFVSFVFISALVMLSLFVGAVTMSMTDSMEQLKMEKEAAYREKVLERAREKAKREQSRSQLSEVLSAEDKPPQHKPTFKAVAMFVPRMISHRLSAPTSGSMRYSGPGSVGSLGGETDTEGFTEQSAEFMRQNSLGRSSLNSVKSKRGSTFETETDADGNGDFDNKEIARLRFLIRKALGQSSSIMQDEDKEKFDSLPLLKRKYLQLSVWAERISSHSWFLNFITLVILFASALVGVTTFFGSDGKQSKEVQQMKYIVSVMDVVVSGIFCGEVFIKTVAYQMQPWQYFFSHGRPQFWNCFDYFIVVGSLVPGGGGTITVLRLLRLLRVLKLLKALPELQIIVIALIKGLGSITYIAVILLLVYYMFAILGMILFQENDPWHFGSLHISLFTLFRCATLEDWTDVMYINMFGCNNYGYDLMENLCVSPVKWGWVSSMYFVLFTLIGGLVLMTLFIGVVTTSMEEASNEQKEQIEVEERVQALKESMALSDDTISTYKSIFGLLDLDGGGTIDEEELAIGFISVGEMFSKSEIKGMVAQVDEDNSGEIDMAEFVEFMNIFKKATEAKVAVEEALRAEQEGTEDDDNEDQVEPTPQIEQQNSKRKFSFFSKADPYQESEALGNFRDAAEETRNSGIRKFSNSKRQFSASNMLASAFFGKSQTSFPGVEVYPDPGDAKNSNPLS